MGIDLARALPYLTPAQSADDTAPIMAFGSTDRPIARVFSATLYVNYLIDEPGAFVIVRERDVAADRRDALHAHAVQNLRVHLGRQKLRFERGLDGCTHAMKLDGKHDASLLLLDELWEGPTRVADLAGDLLAAVPTRQLLLFTATGVPNGVDALHAAIARTKGAALTREVLVRRHGGWQSFF